MTEIPTPFVCHVDDGGPRVYLCRRVQEALRGAGIEYDKAISGHGSPWPFLRKGSLEELRAATWCPASAATGPRCAPVFVRVHPRRD
jgi:hypothetical protein